MWVRVSCNYLCLWYNGYPVFGCTGVVFLFTEFPLRQQISCLFYFPHLRCFVAHERILGNLEVIIYFHWFWVSHLDMSFLFDYEFWIWIVVRFCTWLWVLYFLMCFGIDYVILEFITSFGLEFWNWVLIWRLWVYDKRWMLHIQTP